MPQKIILPFTQKHPDRDKEYSSKKIFYWFDNMFDMFRINGFCQDRSHDESSQSGRKTSFRGNDNHSEA